MDDIDRGQENDEAIRGAAVAAHRKRVDAGVAADAAEARYGKPGVCVGCDEPIDPRRLRIKPDAVRCVECQYVWEHYGV